MIDGQRGVLEGRLEGMGTSGGSGEGACLLSFALLWRWVLCNYRTSFGSGPLEIHWDLHFQKKLTLVTLLAVEEDRKKVHNSSKVFNNPWKIGWVNIIVSLEQMNARPFIHLAIMLRKWFKVISRGSFQNVNARKRQYADLNSDLLSLVCPHQDSL